MASSLDFIHFKAILRPCGRHPRDCEFGDHAPTGTFDPLLQIFLGHLRIVRGTYSAWRSRSTNPPAAQSRQIRDEQFRHRHRLPRRTAPQARGRYELIRCRFPLSDGGDNPAWLLRLAAESVAAFLRADIPVAICCSAGMSRSVCVAAAGITLADDRPLAESLLAVVGTGPADVSPGLWLQMKQALQG